MMNEEEQDNPAIHPRYHAQVTDSSDSGSGLVRRLTVRNLSPSYTRAAIATSLSSFTEQGTRRHNQTVREPVIQLPDTSNVRYQHFVNSDARKRTFRHRPGSTIWPHGDSIQDTDRLVEQGFFYTGRLDLCRCYFCGLGLKDWSADDDVVFVHLRYSPNCEHIARTVDPNILSVYRRRISETQVAGGITPNIPESGSPTTIRHPEFESYPVRLASFQAWPGDLMQTPEMLAEAGFFHTGLRDVVRCYACDGGLQRWDAGDQPWVEHARWFPECPHVIRVKGEEYIRIIQAATDNDEDEEDLEANAEVPVDSVYPLYSDAARTVMELGFSRKAVSIAIDECKAKNMPLTADNMMNILLDKQDKGEELPTDDPRPSSPKLPKFNEATKEGLLEEREYLRSRLICIQCDDRECNTLFLPCGHLRMCTECSTNVEVCPLCSRLDLCRCYFCGLGLKDWSADDDVVFVHLRYSPNCEHIARTVDPNILSVYRRRISESQVAGGITPNIPESGSPTTTRHPEFESYPVRLASFQAWPGDLMQTPEMLAEAGFFHTGLRDVVRCYACDGGLQRWDAGDQPWVEHARWFPECPHVIRVKGEAYIQLIQAATDNDEDEEDPEANAEVPVVSVYPLYSDTARTVLELGFSRKAVSIAIDECKANNMRLTADNMMNILLDKQDKGVELPTDDPRPSSPKLPKFNEATKEGLLEEREYLRSRLICVQCDDRECNTLFLPCGHLRMCTECSTNVEVCPLCSKAILQKIKTYMS